MNREPEMTCWNPDDGPSNPDGSKLTATDWIALIVSYGAVAILFYLLAWPEAWT